jgi:PAS domain S-box-containing protein
MTTSPTTDDRTLLETQVRELYRTSNLASVTSVVIATFLGAILWPVASLPVLLAWYASICTIALARVITTWRYRQAFDAEPRFWLMLHAAGLFLTGLCWGAVLLFIVPVNERFHLISAIFVIAGLATASAGSMASVKHGFAVFSIPALLPGALKLIMLDENITVLIGCAIGAFLVFIAMAALRIHDVILYSLRKQFESAKFVVEVQEIHEALVARYDELESELKRSTQKIQELQAQLDEQDAQRSALAGDMRAAKGDRFTYLLDKLHGGAWNYNLKTREIRFSPQWLNMLGYKDNEVYTTLDFWKSLLHPDEADDVVAKLQAHLDDGIEHYFSSHRLRTRAGTWKWVFSRAQPVAWGTYGEVLDMVCVEIDIEDPETWLARRLGLGAAKAGDRLHTEASFMQRLQYAAQTTSIENVEHALCHIRVASAELPLDVNTPGNELATQLASILVRACRQEDPILELGNTGFAVLLENLSIDTALNKAESLRRTIDAHQFIVHGQHFRVSAAIGITPIFDTRRSAAAILEDAATACARAIDNAPDHVFVFQRDEEAADADTLQKRIVASITDVLDNKRLQLTPIALKPLANGGTTKLTRLTAALPGLKHYGAALGHLHDPAGESALSKAFDLCVIRMFLDWAGAQPATLLQTVHIVDCKPGSILDADFRARVQQLFTHAPPGHSLCIGIPEDTFIAHEAEVRAFIDTLKPAGICFALTGFGIGAIAFDYMKSLPVDYLELHEQLIAGIDSDKTSLVTIKYLNEMCHVLNLKTIAFGDEAQLHEAALAGIGTDYIRDFAAKP